MKLITWGSRGSFPASGDNYTVYGGHTSCFSIELPDRYLILDAGSGLAVLGDQIAAAGKLKRIDIFISHMHLDHVLGLFDFKLFFHSDAEIHLYGPGTTGMTFQSQIEQLIRPPVWPVGFADFPASITFHELTQKTQYRITENVTITGIQGKHPGDSLLYKLTIGSISIFYGLDCEMDDEIWADLLVFAAGCQLLICDAQYAPGDYERYLGWGHSSWEQGLALRRQTGAKAVLLAHFGRKYDDKQLALMEKQVCELDGAAIFARTGLEIRLDTINKLMD